jgi:hypothetical protein
MQHWNKVWLVVMVLLLQEGMADMTKVTYTLNICFFLTTFKANNWDFYSFCRNNFVTSIIRYILRFLHNSIKWEMNCAAHEQTMKTWKLTVSSTANYTTCHGLLFCVGSERFMSPAVISPLAFVNMEVRVTRRQKFTLLVTEDKELTRILGHKTQETTVYTEMCLTRYLITPINFKVKLTS